MIMLQNVNLPDA
jgi:feruloyl esterase